MTKKFPKRTIRENRYGNWYGYEGGKRVTSFMNDSDGTQEDHAKMWLSTQDAADDLIRDLLAAEQAFAGLAMSVEDEDVVAAVRARVGYKDIDERLHTLAQDVAEIIDTL